MKKRILTILLASAVLSTTACQKKEYKVSCKDVSATDTQILKAAAIPSEVSSDPTVGLWDGDLSNHTTRQKNQYDVSMKLDYITRSLEVLEELTYVNNTGSAQSEIYFNVVSDGYYDDGGDIRIGYTNADGASATFSKVNDTVYSLKLPSTLEVDGTVHIEFKYTIVFPDGAYRLGTTGNTFNLGHAILTPSLYENGHWLSQPYIELGDAFYSEISDYRVSIDVPDGYKVASTGTKINGVYVAEDVRDFAMVVSSEMNILCEEYGDIALFVYYPKKCPHAAELVMDTAKKSLDLYDSLLGEYPYDTLTLVLSNDTVGVGGMEYPGLITINTDSRIESGFQYQNPAINPITRAVANGIAHQWFYGIVGNDQIRHAWIDEGMCRFMEALYCDCYNENQGEYTLLQELSNEDQGIYDAYFGGSESCFNMKLNSSLYDINRSHPQEYIEVSYKSAAMIYHIYRELGPDAFVSAIRDYVAYFSYTEVTPEEFFYFWNLRGDFEEMFTIYFT
ncbi:MAG: M1 family metallopeptidase [Clostridiales bacterium]|nr:M1 family metallopeptidase [Clostridiales bacterium]